MVKTVLITGGAKRLGAAIARVFHAADYNVVLHYRTSEREVAALCGELNTRRSNSSAYVQADLLKTETPPALVERAVDIWGGLDVLVNNASAFYPTPFGRVTDAQWDELIGSNLRAPFFLAQAAAPHLRVGRGVIVNIGDIHAERMLKDYPVYSIAKAALHALTRSLAKELAPEVRVNAVAPGAILWPETAPHQDEQRSILERIPLGRTGEPDDVARAVLFLCESAPYITGQILAIDGGRSLFS